MVDLSGSSEIVGVIFGARVQLVLRPGREASFKVQCREIGMKLDVSR